MSRPYAELAKGQDLDDLVKALHALNRELIGVDFSTIPEPLTYSWVQQNKEWEALYCKIKMLGDSVLFNNPDISLRAYSDVLKVNGFPVVKCEHDKEALEIEALNFIVVCGPHLAYHEEVL